MRKFIVLICLIPLLVIIASNQANSKRPTRFGVKPLKTKSQTTTRLADTTETTTTEATTTTTQGTTVPEAGGGGNNDTPVTTTAAAANTPTVEALKAKIAELEQKKNNLETDQKIAVKNIQSIIAEVTGKSEESLDIMNKPASELNPLLTRVRTTLTGEVGSDQNDLYDGSLGERLKKAEGDLKDEKNALIGYGVLTGVTAAAAGAAIGGVIATSIWYSRANNEEECLKKPIEQQCTWDADEHECPCTGTNPQTAAPAATN